SRPRWSSEIPGHGLTGGRVNSGPAVEELHTSRGRPRSVVPGPVSYPANACGGGHRGHDGGDVRVRWGNHTSEGGTSRLCRGVARGRCSDRRPELRDDPAT